MARPFRAGLRRQRWDMAHRALGHVARNRRDAIEIPFADAIGQEIDQAGHVGLWFLDQAGHGLLRRQRLRDGGGERHDLDAEAGIDGLDLVGEQPRHALGVAERQGRADAHRLRAAVDAMADEIEPPRAEPLQLERLAELGGELADVARDGFRRADRFGEGAADLDQLLRTDRLDRLGDLAGRLVKAAAELGTEAQRERRARLRQQIADALEAEHAKAVDQIGREAQRRDRKRRDIGGGRSRLGDEGRARREARQRMRRAPGVGDRRRGRECRRQPACRSAWQAWQLRRHADDRRRWSR